MFELGPGEQSELLALARCTLKYFFHTHSPLDYQPQHSSLREPAGVFVSLHREECLRGCVGHLKPDLPLYRNVVESALAAAFQDPRFPPLDAEELDDLCIEISILSPFTLVEDIEEIEVGRHGLLVSMGSHRGLLLPQVPSQYGWNRIQFLGETCSKAGLPPDCWRSGAMIQKFLAQVFNEQKLL